MAAGDDLVIIVCNGYGTLVEDIKNAILSSTSGTKNSDVPIGLG